MDLHYSLEVEGQKFCVPLVEIGKYRIAYLDFLSDRRLIRTCAKALAERLNKNTGAVVVPATGAIPLGFSVAELLDLPFVVLRKNRRGYMKAALMVQVSSVAALDQEDLLLEDKYIAVLRNKPVNLLDTVTSTGATFRAMEQLMKLANVSIATRAVAFTEGPSDPNGDIVSLGRLPLFPRD